MTRFYVVKGQTEPVAVQLFRDNRPVDLTGILVANMALMLYGLDGSLVDASSDIEILDAAAGKIQYNPDTTDFDVAQSPYSGRWKITDGAGVISFWPNQHVDHWFIAR